MQSKIQTGEILPEDAQIISIPIHSTGIYTFSEAAELSKCSYSTIRRAVESGHLKISHIGNQPRIIGARLLEWIEAGGGTSRSKATMQPGDSPQPGTPAKMS